MSLFIFFIFFFSPQSSTFSPGPNSNDLFVWKILQRFGFGNTLSPGESCGVNLRSDWKQAFSSPFFQNATVGLIASKASGAHGDATARECETSTCIVSVTLCNEQVYIQY